MAGHPRQRQAAFVSSSTSISVAKIETDEQVNGTAFPRSILHLLRVEHDLRGAAPDVGEFLVGEVAAITRGCAQLVLNPPYTRTGAHPPRDDVFAGVPIRLETHAYGTLYVASDAAHPELPAFPLVEAHLLADVCGLLLHDLEQSAFMDAQMRHLGERPVPEPLTYREHEILKLICLGYDKAGIAAELTISPKTVDKHQQHIYEKLAVHNEREACLVAYWERLVSFLT